jgi:hypothetical protein
MIHGESRTPNLATSLRAVWSKRLMLTRLTLAYSTSFSSGLSRKTASISEL